MKENKQPRVYSRKNIIIFLFVLFLPFIFYLIANILIKYNICICIWKNIFHKECWGCGITRAFLALINLDIKSAINYNSKILIIAPLLIYIWIRAVINAMKSIKI